MGCEAASKTSYFGPSESETGAMAAKELELTINCENHDFPADYDFACKQGVHLNTLAHLVDKLVTWDES